MTNTDSGIVPLTASRVTSDNITLPRPMNCWRPPPSPKAIPYPATSQTIDIKQASEKHCINTESAFLLRTSPP